MRKLIVGLLIAGAVTTAQSQVVAPQLIVSAVGSVVNIVRLSLDLGEGKRDYYKVEVRGQGATFEQARKEALRVAVAEAVGEVIASQIQTNGDRVTRDEIISYSSGYVDKYTVDQRTQVGNQVEVLMTVYVANSKIANRLLGNSAGEGKVDGDRHSTQITSIMEEQTNKQRLIGTVLADYPQRAFKMTVGKATTTRLVNHRDIIYDGGVSISFPVEVEWDSNYIDALGAALKATETKCGWGGMDKNCTQPGAIRIRKNMFNTPVYEFANFREVSGVVNKLTTNSVIQATVRNTQGNVVDYRCWDMNTMAATQYIPTMGGAGPNQLNLVVYANSTSKYNLSIDVPAITMDRVPLATRIAQYDNVDFKIVTKNMAQCSK